MGHTKAETRLTNCAAAEARWRGRPLYGKATLQADHSRVACAGTWLGTRECREPSDEGDADGQRSDPPAKGADTRRNGGSFS